MVVNSEIPSPHHRHHCAQASAMASRKAGKAPEEVVSAVEVGDGGRTTDGRR